MQTILILLLRYYRTFTGVSIHIVKIVLIVEDYEFLMVFHWRLD